MERLTIPDEKIEGGVRRAVIDTRKVKEHAMTIYWALKKYEDTGLTPQEILGLKERVNDGWIPVDERLPEESLKSVIGWDNYRKRCCFVQFYNGRWNIGISKEPVKITAWRPLPDPYCPERSKQ